MWYCVDKDGSKFLLGSKPERQSGFDDEENETLSVWGFRMNELDLGMEYDIVEIQDDQVASMGLPDMTWDDEPIKVKLICVNI